MTEYNNSCPIFNSNKPTYVFMKELKEYSLNKIKPKYNLILEFINKSCDLKLKFLKDFKKINLKNINIDYFETILYDYKYKLEGELCIDIDDIHIDIIKILSDCLSAINYSIYVFKKKNNNNIDYILTIIDK